MEGKREGGKGKREMEGKRERVRKEKSEIEGKREGVTEGEQREKRKKGSE